MTWFAAHIIMYAQYKTGAQHDFPVWENIVLVRAATSEDAFRRADEYGKREEGDSRGSFEVNGVPSTLVFGGVRKLVQCLLGTDETGTIVEPVEMTYNELTVVDRQALQRLIDGVDVGVELSAVTSYVR